MTNGSLQAMARPQAPTNDKLLQQLQQLQQQQLGTIVCVWMNKFLPFSLLNLTPEELRKTGESDPTSRSGWPGRKARVLGVFDGVGGGDVVFTCEKESSVWVWWKKEG